MIEAVVFDMDGLLVDSEPLWQRARVEAFGADRLRWTEADQQRVMGSSTQAWAVQIQEKLGPDYTLDEIIDRVLGQMQALYRQAVPLMPGAREVIDLLRGRYPLGLASGSPYRLIKTVLHEAGWDGVFSHVLSTDDLPRGKPAPDIYLAIAERMGVSTERIAVFEDSPNGILAALDAGTRVIAVPGRDYRLQDGLLQRASLVLGSLHDLRLEMLERL